MLQKIFRFLLLLLDFLYVCAFLFVGMEKKPEKVLAICAENGKKGSGRGREC